MSSRKRLPVTSFVLVSLKFCTFSPTTFPTIPRWECREDTHFGVESKEFSCTTAEVFVSRSALKCFHARVGDLCGVSGDMMSARMMVGVRSAGLALRASRDGLMRVAWSGCAGQRQQTRAASAEVSAAEVL